MIDYENIHPLDFNNEIKMVCCIGSVLSIELKLTPTKGSSSKPMKRGQLSVDTISTTYYFNLSILDRLKMVRQCIINRSAKVKKCEPPK